MSYTDVYWLKELYLSKYTSLNLLGFIWNRYTCLWVYCVPGHFLIKVMFSRLATIEALILMSTYPDMHTETCTLITMHAGFNVISMFCLSVLADKKPMDSFRSCILQICGECVWVYRQITGLQVFTDGLMEGFFPRLSWNVLAGRVVNSKLKAIENLIYYSLFMSQ